MNEMEILVSERTNAINTATEVVRVTWGSVCEIPTSD